MERASYGLEIENVSGGEKEARMCGGVVVPEKMPMQSENVTCYPHNTVVSGLLALRMFISVRDGVHIQVFISYPGPHTSL